MTYTKEQVWTARVCEVCGYWWKPRSNAAGINCPQCNRQTVTDIEVIPLTTAKEQVEAAETALDAIRAHWKAKYAGKPRDSEPDAVHITPEDGALYEVSTRLRTALSSEEAGEG